MNTYLVGKAELEAANQTRVKLEYYLTEETRDVEVASALYGVEVKKESRNKCGIFREQESARCLSYSREIVEGLVRMLLANTVTPMNLIEVVDDYISKKGLSA